MAGNFFVIKASARPAEKGAELDELVTLGEKVNSVTRTMGIALTSCTPPAKGSPLFDLGDDEMEVGVGIHGEPGRRRAKLGTANEIVDELLDAIVPDLPYKSGDHVALMINGLGGTPISELYMLYGLAHEQLAERGHQRHAQLRRRVLHLARDGRRIADAGQARRRDRRAVRRAGRRGGAHLLRHRTRDVAGARVWCRRTSVSRSKPTRGFANTRFVHPEGMLDRAIRAMLRGATAARIISMAGRVHTWPSGATASSPRERTPRSARCLT